MHRLGKAAALLAWAIGLAGCGWSAADRSAGSPVESRAASLGADLGGDFSGYHLWVHGKRSSAVDSKYPCLAEFMACLPLDGSGTSQPVKDLCPSIDTPEGTWDFEYALYTDAACTLTLENVACAIAREEQLSSGPNSSQVLCISNNAQKDFDVCLYDPVTKAGYGQCDRLLVVTGGVPASFVEDVRAKQLATGRFAKVDVLDATFATPTLADLGGYTVVLTFTDHYESLGYADPFALGDVLASYVETGGRVVAAVFANASIPILGRFERDYLLIQPVWHSAPSSVLGTIDEPGSPLLADVTTFGATNAYGSIGGVIHGGIVVARWSDGRPLIVRGTFTDPATGAVRRRVDLNLYPPSSGVVDPSTHAVLDDFWTGDGTAILRNALLFK